MNIDAHQHFWIYDPAEYGWVDDSMPGLRRDFLPADLKPELDRNNFQGCVAVQARQTLEETQWLLRLAEENPFVLGVVGWVDLRSPHLRDDLSALAKNPKLVGVRHVVQAESDDRFLLQPDFLRGIAALEEFDLAYDILIYPKHLPVAAEFVSRFPRHRFVLDHLAKPFIKRGVLQPWQAQLKQLASFSNVFCKLSGMVTEADWDHWTPEHITPYLDAAFECFGVERLMIGSDWPVCTLAASYTRTMDVVKDYLMKYPGNARSAVLGGNAAKFWKMNVAA
jgi:L-fuconolactonase